MTEWWEALSSLGKVFACIAIPATVVLLIQTILSIIGLGSSDGDADVPDGGIDVDGDGVPDVFPDATPDGIFGSDIPDDGDVPDSGFRLLSLRTIIAFLTIFGWVGLITLKQGLPTVWSLVISFASGFAAMFLVALAVAWMMRFQTDGTRDIRNALGKSGTVYLRVPANREGNGKVNLMLQDAFVELDAVTDEENAIPSGREVVVIGLSGQSTLVVKSK